MDKRHVILLALVGLIVLVMVIIIIAAFPGPAGQVGMLPPSGIEKIDTRCMDSCTVSEEGRIAFLNAAVERLLSRTGEQEGPR